MSGYRYHIHSALYQKPLLRSEAWLKCVQSSGKFDREIWTVAETLLTIVDIFLYYNLF